MERRLRIQQELESILGTDSVYYQPPSNIRLTFPCIVYKLADMYGSTANNKKYTKKIVYQITYISRDVDDPIVDRLYELQGAVFERQYVEDSIYHTIFRLNR